jgi:hypothetical protein
VLGILIVTAGRSSAALVCGEPSRVRPVSPAVGPAARVGPLWFVVPPGPRAVVQLLPDYPALVSPTKVLIYVQRPLRAPIRLRGRRCSDGRPLRFFYRNAGDLRDLPQAGPAADLERVGDRVATLAAGEPPTVVPALGYPGYMLFSAPGKWKVSVHRGRRLLGSAIIRAVP